MGELRRRRSEAADRGIHTRRPARPRTSRTPCCSSPAIRRAGSPGRSCRWMGEGRNSEPRGRCHPPPLAGEVGAQRREGVNSCRSSYEPPPQPSPSERAFTPASTGYAGEGAHRPRHASAHTLTPRGGAACQQQRQQVARDPRGLFPLRRVAGAGIDVQPRLRNLARHPLLLGSAAERSWPPHTIAVGTATRARSSERSSRAARGTCFATRGPAS